MGNTGTMGKELRMYTARWEEDNWEQHGGPNIPIEFWDYGIALRKAYGNKPNGTDCGPCFSGYHKLGGNQCNTQDLRWEWCMIDDHKCTKSGDGYRLKTVYPDRKYLNSRAMVLDSTPNYLMTPQVPRRIFENALDPSQVKFVVLLREPIARTFSEWSMYGFKNYKKDLRPFHQAINEELREFKECESNMSSSSNDISGENSLFHKCFTGEGMQYVRNSLYSEGLKEWFKYFRRDQFFLLDTDMLKYTHPPKLISNLADFLGIEFNYTFYSQNHPKMLDLWKSQCRSPRGDAKGAMHMAVGSKITDNMKNLLIDVFGPYNEELKAMLPDFEFYNDWKTRL